MKKIYLLLLIFTLQKTFAQNTFPTSGNVGIGTSSPSYLLDVNSSAQRLYNPTGSTILRLEGNGTATYAGSYIYLNAGTPRSGDTFTKARIDANRGTDSTSIFQFSRMNGDTYTGIFYQYGDLAGHRFFTPASRTATSTSEVFRISPDGRVGIGSTTLTNRTLALGAPISGGTTAYGMLNNGLVKSDVTAGAYLNYSQLNTQATSFTLPTAVHFLASEGAIGAGSSVTSQIGFWVSSNMASATNNFGYRSAIPVGTNNWNLYLEGAASNYVAGALGVGSTSLVGNSLRVSRSITGAATSIGVRSDGQVQPDVTGAAYYYRSDASTAASTATNSITHYFSSQSALGSGSVVDNQTGFSVAANLIGATNNYGFYGNIPAGTGRWNLYMGGTANNYMGGRLGMGTSTLDFSNHSISLPLTGNASFYSSYNFGLIQSDVTGVAAYYRTAASTQAATFTLGNIVHYGAYQGTIGAGSTVTNQYGVYVDSGLIGATNNYGLFSTIPAGTGRWNLYANGTANNYLGGRTGIGTTSLSDKNVGLSLPLTGSTTNYGFLSNGVVQTDVTGSARYFNTIANVAASANVADLIHYIAESTTFGAGSTVAAQTGFYVPSSLTAATNNYAFRGHLAAATGRWNLYMAGTANNYLEGNLGIGTATPTLKLEVIDANGIAFRHSQAANTAGTFRLMSGAYSGNKMDGMVFSTTSTLNNIGIGGGTALGEPANNIYFYTAPGVGTNGVGTIRMNIDSAGHAGIPGATKGFSFQVNRAMTPTSGGTTGVGIVSAGPVQASGLTSTRYFQSTATVSSGITTGQVLHFYAAQGTFGSTVSDQAGFHAGSTLIGATNNYGFRGQIAAGTGRWNLYMDGTASNYLEGGLALGTTTIPAGYKMAIAGNIIAEKVKVKKQASGWPDYVFSPEYKLPSLEEVEKFTKENSHLPEIPSAKEIEKEGQDLGEMNRLLLKKVEELTLYVIDLKKQSDKQNQKIEKQNQEIEKLKK